jgi:chromosome segregation ATPase
MRIQLERAENEHKECSESLTTIESLHTQFQAADAVLTKQKKKCFDAKRSLRMAKMQLAQKTKEWEDATVVNEKAQAFLKQAKEDEALAKAERDSAQATLEAWQKHMAELMRKIEAQTRKVKDTFEALQAADRAATAVSDFKDKLATALTGLVDYYDEAVRQPLRSMGIREEVNIEDRFPQPSETTAADNLRIGLAATKEFCVNKRQSLAKLPEIEADGAKLTAICEEQKWEEVASEVHAAITQRRTSSIANLKLVQQKVKPYTGTVANKDKGEVEGVWKAMAIYGDTDFSKNYLSGWKFSQDGATKGLMMELATALDNARKKAATRWEEAKQALKELEEEKANVENILEQAAIFLKEMIVIYEKAKVTREDAAEKATKAKAALDIVTAEKVELESKVDAMKQTIEGLDSDVANANASLKETHVAAMGSFMELLHAAEQEQGGSWD